MAIVLLVLSELMIRRLIKGLESPFEFFVDRNRRFSFRIFHRSEALWIFTYYFLWYFSGFLVYLIFSGFRDLAALVFFLFFIASMVRRNRSWKDIQRMHSRVKRTMKWEDIELYRDLIETENSNFMQIFDSPLRLEDLERATKHTKRAIMFDPKTMEKIVSKDEITSRLRLHLEFLQSELGSIKYSIEEIYVILFMLSEKARFKEFAEEMLSNLDALQSLID